ncbi:MAG: hypothetical protein JRI68_15940 [Deltaproteobacteria bacterium]|nr:hypothetical protein [Deltaproteobacteria bacterium]
MLRRIVLLATLALWLPACATTNVRAMRAYAYEDANFLVALDRIEDVAEVLRLLDEVMTTLPYSPGDDWVDELALSDERAEEMKSAIVNRPPYDDDEFAVPIVKLYRFHLGDVVRKVRKAKREEEPAYDSLLDAMKDLSAGNNVLDQWKTYQSTVAGLAEAEENEDEVRAKYAGQLANRQTLPPDLVEAQQEVKDAEAKVMMAGTRLANSVKAMQQADLRGGPRKQIAADALTAFSVALRVDLEALALIPFAVTNMVRSVDEAPAAMLANIKNRHAFKAVEQLSDLPRLAVTIEEQLERQLALTQAMTDTLAALTTTELGDTAGFMLQESVVDQIVGITIDSFHADLKVDAEVFFFGQIDGDETLEETKDEDGNVTSSKNFTGRTRRLEYEVAPIWMLGVQLNAGFDWIKLPNVGSLKAGFATDRVFSQGGEIETSSSLGEQLGLEGFASDIFDLGLGVLGVRTNVKMATFNFGYVAALEVDPTDGDDQGIAKDADGNDEESNFQLQYTQIDVGYDIAFLVYEWASRYYVEEFWLGYRYFDYRLPRVLYEMEGGDHKTFFRQSPAQNLDSTYHMGGFRLRMGPGGAPRFHPYGDLGLYVGAGPTAYYFCEGSTEANTCTEEPANSDKDEYVGSVFAVNVALALGLRLRLTPKRWPLLAHLGVQYSAEFVGGDISQEQEGSDQNRSIDLGSSEIFHGPQLHLRGEL